MITLNEDYEVELRRSDFNYVIGRKKSLKEEYNYGTYTPSLYQDTDILSIHCDLVHESLIDGSDSDIVYSVSTSILRPSYSFTLEPQRVTYKPINKNIISSIRIYITDGKRRIIDLNGSDTSFSLILKQILQ